MPQPGHHSRRAVAAVLLAVFLAGGVLAPLAHRAHHGLRLAMLRADAVQACDHSRHGVGFEVAVPSLLHDDCLLCVRHVFHFDGLEIRLGALLSFGDYAPYLSTRLYAPPLSSFLIRGPPEPA